MIYLYKLHLILFRSLPIITKVKVMKKILIGEINQGKTPKKESQWSTNLSNDFIDINLEMIN